jgi:hypothetical protein
LFVLGSFILSFKSTSKDVLFPCSSHEDKKKSAVKDYLAQERGERIDDEAIVFENPPVATAIIRNNHAENFFRRDREV